MLAAIPVTFAMTPLFGRNRSFYSVTLGDTWTMYNLSLQMLGAHVMLPWIVVG